MAKSIKHHDPTIPIIWRNSDEINVKKDIKRANKRLFHTDQSAD